MDATYEIFRDDPQGPLWIESVVGLDRAAKRLADMYKVNPASYFAYDPCESRIVATLPLGWEAGESAGSQRRKSVSNAG